MRKGSLICSGVNKGVNICRNRVYYILYWGCAEGVKGGMMAQAMSGRCHGEDLCSWRGSIRVDLEGVEIITASD